MTQAYPLHWPQDFPRTSNPKKSKFNTSIFGALNNVNDELRRFGKDSEKPVTNVLVSSNVSLGIHAPKDGAVAVYFRWENMDCCIAVDRYLRPEENLQAISLIIESQRTQLRHGGLNIVRASFRGFAALPPPAPGMIAVSRPWWDVLGFDNDKVKLQSAEEAYRIMVKRHHPDRGGDPAIFNQIADAIRQAREILQ